MHAEGQSYSNSVSIRFLVYTERENKHILSRKLGTETDYSRYCDKIEQKSVRVARSEYCISEICVLCAIQRPSRSLRLTITQQL